VYILVSFFARIMKKGVKLMSMFYEKTDIFAVIKKIIFSARTGDYGAASQEINQFLVLLQAELSKGRISAASLSKITFSLETMVEMQKSGDWVAVADILEFEFTPLWKEVAV
jgi:hypothetical protein